MLSILTAALLVVIALAFAVIYQHRNRAVQRQLNVLHDQLAELRALGDRQFASQEHIERDLASLLARQGRVEQKLGIDPIDSLDLSRAAAAATGVLQQAEADEPDEPQ